jgi:peptidoglycan hydrolase CwlO-like protein
MSFAKKYLLFFVGVCSIFFIGSFTHAQTPTPNIDQLKQKVAELGQQKKTLSSQIEQMDTQIALATAQVQRSEQKIIETQHEIEKLSSRIDNLDSSLDTLSKLLLRQVAKSYKTRSISLIELLFETKDMDDLTNKIKYLRSSQNNNQKLLMQVQEAKLSYEEQKVIREQKKQELDQLIISLNKQKEDLKTQQAQKERLLAETNNDEATYQTLLAQAEAQLKGFGQFVSNRGGSSLLSNQTVCDDWGCYYNQRDSQWGNNSLNGTGYTLASDGCLVTSMAMVYTHFGHRSVTPQTINSNPFNFASYYPAYLNMTIVADGTTSTRVYSSIDSELSSGRPVVVGISYDGGPNPDHFLVLISGSNGDYKMNDPYTPNGHNIPFTDHYSVGSIRTINRINM